MAREVHWRAYYLNSSCTRSPWFPPESPHWNPSSGGDEEAIISLPSTTEMAHATTDNMGVEGTQGEHQAQLLRQERVGLC